MRRSPQLLNDLWLDCDAIIQLCELIERELACAVQLHWVQCQITEVLAVGSQMGGPREVDVPTHLGVIALPQETAPSHAA